MEFKIKIEEEIKEEIIIEDFEVNYEGSPFSISNAHIEDKVCLFKINIYI